MLQQHGLGKLSIETTVVLKLQEPIPVLDKAFLLRSVFPINHIRLTSAIIQDQTHIYFLKASDDHWSISLILCTGTPDK